MAVMNQPANHTVLADRDGDLWVRFDEWLAPYVVRQTTWRHISTGTGWDLWARDKVGSGRSWDDILDYEPLELVSGDRATWALAKVQEAHRAD